MRYGVNINGLDTLSVLNCFLGDDLKIAAPAQKRETVNVPGANGEIDLTYALNPDPVFKNRKITFTLHCVKRIEFHRAIKELMRFHGTECRVILPVNPSHYFEGNVSVEPDYKWGSSKFKITINAFPYAMKTKYTETEIVLDESGHAEAAMLNEMLPVCPEFTMVSGSAAVNGHLIVPDTVNVFDDVKFRAGFNDLEFVGDPGAVVHVRYREGALYV